MSAVVLPALGLGDVETFLRPFDRTAGRSDVTLQRVHGTLVQMVRNGGREAVARERLFAAGHAEHGAVRVQRDLGRAAFEALVADQRRLPVAHHRGYRRALQRPVREAPVHLGTAPDGRQTVERDAVPPQQLRVPFQRVYVHQVRVGRVCRVRGEHAVCRRETENPAYQPDVNGTVT